MPRPQPDKPVAEREVLRRFMDREARVWGVAVRTRRKALGFTLEQAAGLADTTPQTFQKIEKGAITPRDDLRLAVALALATEVAALFPMPDRQTVLREIAA